MACRETSDILWNDQVCTSYFKIGLTCAREYERSQPGQFVMLRIPGQGAPLLNRPFSIHRLIQSGGHLEGIELLYKVVGGFTKRLSSRRPGESIHVTGPLGKGFDLPENARRIMLIGGGVGIAPLRFLANRIIESGIDPENCLVLIGGRSSDDLLCEDEFYDFGMPVYTATEDGSAGKQELITAELGNAVKKNKPDMIYACGPPGMLKSVSRIAEAHKTPCRISLETMMACGMGACLGCAVKSRNNGYFHACMDGPAFNASDIDLE